MNKKRSLSDNMNNVQYYPVASQYTPHIVHGSNSNLEAWPCKEKNKRLHNFARTHQTASKHLPNDVQWTKKYPQHVRYNSISLLQYFQRTTHTYLTDNCIGCQNTILSTSTRHNNITRTAQYTPLGRPKSTCPCTWSQSSICRHKGQWRRQQTTANQRTPCKFHYTALAKLTNRKRKNLNRGVLWRMGWN